MCIPTVCEEGYYCPLGSSSKKQHECGSSAVYCPRGSNTTTPVSVGYYTIGGTSNMTRTSQLKCEPGFFCVDGVKHHCPPGSYGAKGGLTNSNCSGLCAIGHYCPLGSARRGEKMCGSPDKYCPKGQPLPLNVSDGHFTVNRNQERRSDEKICPKGSYCVGGIKRACPAGSFWGRRGLSSPSCSGIVQRRSLLPRKFHFPDRD